MENKSRQFTGLAVAEAEIPPMWRAGGIEEMERVMRFELTTTSLATRDSTTELHPQVAGASVARCTCLVNPALDLKRLVANQMRYRLHL